MKNMCLTIIVLLLGVSLSAQSVPFKDLVNHRGYKYRVNPTSLSLVGYIYSDDKLGTAISRPQQCFDSDFLKTVWNTPQDAGSALVATVKQSQFALVINALLTRIAGKSLSASMNLQSSGVTQASMSLDGLFVIGMVADDVSNASVKCPQVKNNNHYEVLEALGVKSVRIMLLNNAGKKISGDVTLQGKMAEMNFTYDSSNGEYVYVQSNAPMFIGYKLVHHCKNDHYLSSCP